MNEPRRILWDSGTYPGLFPVPVVLISAQDKNGTASICTISWIGVVSSQPPQLGIGLRRSRFTHHLITETCAFVVNIPSRSMLEKTDFCGCTSGKKIDKFAECGFTAVSATKVNAPMINECLVNIECEVSSIVPAGSHEFILAEIVALHANEQVIMPSGNRLDIGRIDPVVLCIDEYWSLGSHLGNVGMAIDRTTKKQAKIQQL